MAAAHDPALAEPTIVGSACFSGVLPGDAEGFDMSYDDGIHLRSLYGNATSDAEAWQANFGNLLKQRNEILPRDFRFQLETLAKSASHRRYSDREHADIVERLMSFLGGDSKANAKLGCSHLRWIATDNRLIRIAIDEIAEKPSSKTPGIDGQTLSDAVGEEHGFTRVELARHIRDELRGESYQPVGLKAVRIEKASGGYRRVQIPTITDRIVQRSALLAIRPFLEAQFLPCSYAFRPGVDRLNALAAAHVRVKATEQTWVVAVDLKDAFPSTPKERLFKVVDKYFHKQPICDHLRLLFSNSDSGVPQGTPLAPILFNLYLHHVLDLKWKKLYAQWGYFRYADDILLTCDSREDAANAYQAIKKLSREAGYQLKTELDDSIVDATTGSTIDWLGYRVCFDPFSVTIAESNWDKARLDITQAAEIPYRDRAAIVEKYLGAWFKQVLPPVSALEAHKDIEDRLTGILLDAAVPLLGHEINVYRHYKGVRDKWNDAVERAGT